MIVFVLNTHSNHGFSSVIISAIRTNATFVTLTVGHKTIKELWREVFLTCETLHVCLTGT